MKKITLFLLVVIMSLSLSLPVYADETISQDEVFDNTNFCSAEEIEYFNNNYSSSAKSVFIKSGDDYYYLHSTFNDVIYYDSDEFKFYVNDNYMNYGVYENKWSLQGYPTSISFENDVCILSINSGSNGGVQIGDKLYTSVDNFVQSEVIEENKNNEYRNLISSLIFGTQNSDFTLLYSSIISIFPLIFSILLAIVGIKKAIGFVKSILGV